MARWRCQRQFFIKNGYHSRMPGRKVLPTFYGWPKGVRLAPLTTLWAKKVAFTAPGSVTNMLILMSSKKKPSIPTP